MAIPGCFRVSYKRAKADTRLCDSWPVPPSSSTIFVLHSEASRSLEPPSPTRPLEMSLISRQSINFEVFDDQSPTLYNSYVGNWTHFTASGFTNGTITATPTPGASLTFAFSGTRVVDSLSRYVALTLRWG